MRTRPAYLLRGIGSAAIAALLFLAPLQAPATEVDEEYEFYPLPPGEGVEEVYYNCIACHSLRTVTNGGYSRRVWDELLDWMVEDQGMPELPPEEREIILDYLSTHIDEEWEGQPLR
jgi:mono/diheme cytochrome c family protein